MVDEFFVHFIEEIVKDFTGKTTLEGAQAAQWVRESPFFREYIEGQRAFMINGVLDARRILVATFCVGYQLALFTSKSPEPPADGRNRPV